MPRNDLVVLDFETSGLSPSLGDRPIEIGAVVIRDNRVVNQFQSLMNPGFKVSSFIQDYTGISNRMLATAPTCERVMAKFAEFISGQNLVAHNASFDSKFLDAELNRLGLRRTGSFACSMLTARRVIPSAPDYKLGTLVAHLGLCMSGQAHRALADAQAASGVWLHMIAELKRTYALRSVPFELMQRLGKIPKRTVPAFLAEQVPGRRR
jgi:DNA polymerase-3 subunit epsilon